MTADEIRFLLPDVFRRVMRPGSPLSATLDVMEALHAPVERTIEDFPDLLDPRRTADHLVPMLARWVDLDRLFDERARGGPGAAHRLLPSGLGRLRELVALAALLSQWRGTARGLRLFLETATGVKGFRIDDHVAGDDGRPRPFHMRISCPADAKVHQHLIRLIVESEKPAYVTCDELTFEPENA